MRRVRVLAVGLAAALCAGCGGPPNLTMQILTARPASLTVSINNLGDSSTGPLTLTLLSGGVFYYDDDGCSGQTVAPFQHCFVRLGYPASPREQPEGTLTVDDGRGAHATITLTTTQTIAKFFVQVHGQKDVMEGHSASAQVWVDNTGNTTSGPITVDFPPGSVTNDKCNGATVAAGLFCTFDVQYSAPIGQHEPVTIFGSIDADPGNHVPIAVYFNVLPLIYASGPWFGRQEPAGASSTVQVVNENGSEGGMIPVGPLQLSIERANGLPQVDYPPFVIVPGEDQCSGKTLVGYDHVCMATIALDPRLPAGGSYNATLMIRGGDEKLAVPLEAKRGP